MYNYGYNYCQCPNPYTFISDVDACVNNPLYVKAGRTLEYKINNPNNDEIIWELYAYPQTGKTTFSNIPTQIIPPTATNDLVDASLQVQTPGNYILSIDCLSGSCTATGSLSIKAN